MEDLQVFIGSGTITGAFNMVVQLADAKCSAILMVRGFGASRFLFDRVKQKFRSRAKTISALYRSEVAVVCRAVYV